MFFSSDGTIGVHRNKPIVSLTVGYGIAFGSNTRKSISIVGNSLFGYNELTSKGETELLLGGVYQPWEYLGVGYFRSVGNEDITAEQSFFDIKSRWSVILYPTKGGKFILNFNMSQSGDSYLGFDYAIPILGRPEGYDTQYTKW
jgi:hypothetical protein